MIDPPKKRKRRERYHDEAQMVALALWRLRRDAGMTVWQLSAESKMPVVSLQRYEQGERLLRIGTLRRVVAAMGVTMMDLYRA